jgi:hypothetical protein
MPSWSALFLQAANAVADVAAACRRLLRFCCYMVCCQRSCGAKRALRNQYALLFGRGTKIIKVGGRPVVKVMSGRTYVRSVPAAGAWLLN